LEGIATLGLSDAELREAQLIISGHVHAAKLQRTLLADQSFDQLRQAATTVQDEFLTDAARRIDDLILAIATRNSHWFLLYRAGRNFFYDTFWLNKPHLDTSFYIPAALFLVVWAALFVMAFTGRLRSGLTRRIQELSQQLAAVKMGAGLFPEIEHQCLEYSHERDRLESFLIKIDGIRDQYAGSSELGAVKN
jgi:hypothetical protein